MQKYAIFIDSFHWRSFTNYCEASENVIIIVIINTIIVKSITFFVPKKLIIMKAKAYH